MTDANRVYLTFIRNTKSDVYVLTNYVGRRYWNTEECWHHGFTSCVKSVNIDVEELGMSKDPRLLIKYTHPIPPRTVSGSRFMILVYLELGLLLIW